MDHYKDRRHIKLEHRMFDRIFDYYELKEQSIYSKEDEKFVIRTLSPEFNIVPNISNIIEEAEYNFNRMTFEQSKLIDYLDCQRVASIQGGAGTGKTLLAIEKIKKLLEICHNFHLSSQIEFTFECNLDDITEEILYLLKLRYWQFLP